MPDDAPVISTRFPATSIAMAKAWREWLPHDTGFGNMPA
jgi:hypothetical protein